MTRQQMLAQEGAREAYKGYSDDAVTARNGYMRGYREGYEQAEKDLALTWENVRDIIKIEQSSILPRQDSKEYYEEVLRRFNDLRHKK